MSDRELLLKAAKAAGMDYLVWTPGAAPIVPAAHRAVHDRGAWHPLTDDGDALRLAVQIGPLEFSISEYGTAVRQPKGQWFGCEAHLHGGKQAATRRAIVRAAASLATQEEGKTE